MKDLETLPICYFPTTVFCIDDNAEFLSNLILSLSAECSYKLITDAEEFVAGFKENLKLHNWLDHFITSFREIAIEEYDDVIERAGFFDISKLYHKVYDENRFAESSIMLVDYDLPKISGLEICRYFKKINVKKIMLTGVADYPIAVNAFNENIINKFVEKNSHLMIDKVNLSIAELQWEYFQDLAKNIIKMLPLETINLLLDKKFIKFFKNLMKEKNTAEFYLIDHKGSFMLVSFSGELSWLVITDQRAAIDYCEVASDHNAPSELITELRFAQKTLFFFTEEQRKLDVSEWPKYLHSTKEFPDKKGYYYVVIDQNSVHNLVTERIVSHHSYLKKIAHK